MSPPESDGGAFDWSALDLAGLNASLRGQPDHEQPCPDWLTSSYWEPREFWAWLRARHMEQNERYTKSVLGTRYCFFSDMFNRNMDQNSPAFQWCDYAGEIRAISYRDLSLAASARAAAWTREGLSRGQVLAIVDTMGRECIISIAAALKIGAVFSWLTPEAEWLARRRLRALEADWIACAPQYSAMAEEIDGGRLSMGEVSVEDSLAQDAFSADYLSGSPVALHFNVSDGGYRTPTPLVSDDAYMAALRDGVVALGLRRGATYAALGFDEQRIFPALLFAGWLTGATYVHVSPDALLKYPQLLSKLNLETLLISEAARDVLTQAEINLEGQVRKIVRDLATGPDLTAWIRFASVCQTGNIWMGNQLWNAARGGTSLFSQYYLGRVHADVWPSAGQPFELLEPVTTQLAAGRHGLLAPVPLFADAEDEGQVTPILIAGKPTGYVFADLFIEGRGPYWIPADDMVTIVGTLHGCLGLLFAMTPGVREDGRASLDCVVFHTETAIPQEIERTIRARVEFALGGPYVPDRVVFYQFTPPFENGRIDESWCRSRHQTGLLNRRKGHPVFDTISTMRSCLNE
ncbi:MAG: hypothetical protein VX589_18285 [Myxococcota bacterium]|nr:hypothetical protein [Myxococcota bacterium]